jgi:tRNA(Ile2) C34 agmatinyltransferase TiaS
MHILVNAFVCTNYSLAIALSEPHQKKMHILVNARHNTVRFKPKWPYKSMITSQQLY